MSRRLRIAVADDEPDMRDYFRAILPRLGHDVVGAAACGAELLLLHERHAPDLVITDIKMPDSDGIEAVLRFSRPVPVIVVSAHHDEAQLTRVSSEQFLVYLVKPITQADLEPAIAIAMRRFEQFQALRREAAELRQGLEDRKLIERAKGLLMKKTGLDEPAAFKKMQRLASEQNLKLAALARILVTADQAFTTQSKPAPKPQAPRA